MLTVHGDQLSAGRVYLLEEELPHRDHCLLIGNREPFSGIGGSKGSRDTCHTRDGMDNTVGVCGTDGIAKLFFRADQLGRVRTQGGPNRLTGCFIAHVDRFRMKGTNLFEEKRRI